MTSPPSPQEKQWYSSLPGVTLNDGDTLVVERAQALEAPAARRPQLQVLAHDVCDGGTLADCGDVFLTNTTRHGFECMAVAGGGAARLLAGSPSDGE